MNMKAQWREGLSDQAFSRRGLMMMGAASGAPINVVTAGAEAHLPVEKAAQPEGPASRDDLEAMVANARRAFPLNVPHNAAETLAASGATPTQARARLFEMITGASGLTAGRPLAAHLVGGRA